MKNKPDDILYCGVDENKIKNAKVILNQDLLKKYRDYQYNRADIYYKKEIQKLPAPWTNDPILQKYSFTNVKREFDRESKILLNNVIYNKKCDLFNAVLNSFFVRAFYSKAHILNNLEDGFINFYDTSKDYADYIGEKIPENISDTAYLLCGCRRAVFVDMGYPKLKKSVIFFKFLQKYSSEIEKTILQAKSPLEATKLNVTGIKGKFTIYQVLMDLGYHSEFKFSNNEFVLSGPGCSLGISYLCEDMGGLNDEEFMFWLRDNICNLIDFNPKEFLHFCDEDNQNWSVNDIENSFCEFSKYIKLEKLQNENVRCRQRYYKPTKENETTIDDF